MKIAYMAKLPSLVTRLAGSALGALFPLQCVGCGRDGNPLCEACVARLPALKPPYCVICAQPSTSSRCRWCDDSPPMVDGIRAPFLMEGNVRKAVLDLKYHNLRAIAPALTLNPRERNSAS